MKIIGLSGGIASGKNLVSEILNKKLPQSVVFDADKINHEILEYDEDAKNQIAQFFPDAVVSNKIDRKILGKIVFADINKLVVLEDVLHEKIRQKYQEFLQKNLTAEFVILNIPLLLETDSYRCDYVIGLIAPIEVRKQRFLQRGVGDEKKFYQITQSQVSDEERIAVCDFVIDTNVTIEQLDSKLEELTEVFLFNSI